MTTAPVCDIQVDVLEWEAKIFNMIGVPFWLHCYVSARNLLRPLGESNTEVSSPTYITSCVLEEDEENAGPLNSTEIEDGAETLILSDEGLSFLNPSTQH